MMTERDLETHSKIVNRAKDLADVGEFIHRLMDLELVQEHNLMNIEALLEADTGTFCHDFWGMINHLDRKECAFKDCFSPRVGVAA